MLMPVRVRLWLEIVLAVACGILMVLTLSVPAWIEALTGFDPDHGDGSREWMVVAGLALVCISLGFAAHSEWRRSRSSAVASI